MNSGDGTARVCARVNEVLKALPTPTGASREEIFEQRNLWSEEIQSTCHQVIEYYKSILILVVSLFRNFRPVIFTNIRPL